MDWNDLRVFLAVARGGGLSAAARNLNSSAQTVGRRMTTLEASLGTMLFVRSPSGYRLTEDGATLLAEAEDVEKSISTLDARMKGKSNDVAGTVRLALPENLATKIVIPALAPLVSKNPDLVLEVLTAIAPVGMARGEADLAMRLVRPKQGLLTVRRVGTMAHGLYAAQSYVDTNPEMLDAPLEHARLIGWTDDYRDLKPALWIERHSGRPPDLAFTSLTAQAAAVVAGLGVALLPCMMSDNLVRLPAPSAPQEPLWLVTHDAANTSRRIRAVYEALTSIMDDAGDRLAGY